MDKKGEKNKNIIIISGNNKISKNPGSLGVKFPQTTMASEYDNSKMHHTQRNSMAKQNQKKTMYSAYGDNSQ